MSLLGFLKKANVEEIASNAKAAVTKGSRQRNPNPALIAIRVWKDGSVYPSQAAIAKFDLEYRKATITKNVKGKNEYEFPDGTGNGLDVIDSREWPQYKGEGALLFVAVVPKNAGKVDLFASTVYDEMDGTPKSSVLEQGAVTFGEKVLLPMLKDVYGVEFTDEKQFIDLEIYESIGEGADAVNVTEKFSTKILHAPKRVARGEDKGKSDYVRRENVKVYGLAPTEMLHEQAVMETVADTEDNGQDDNTIGVVGVPSNATVVSEATATVQG